MYQQQQSAYPVASSSAYDSTNGQQMVYVNGHQQSYSSSPVTGGYYESDNNNSYQQCYASPATSNVNGMSNDLQCYGAYTHDFPDVNSLEPTIWSQQMIQPDQQQQQHSLYPQMNTTNHQPIYQPTSFHHNSPTGSSHTSTGSDESDDFYGWHPYKRSPPAVADFDVRGKKVKQTKKRKPKKDPNEPQKPVSAYALFFRDTQAAIKGQNPNATFGEVSKIVASMWDQLDADAKNAYKQKTESAKKDYLKQLAAYRANLLSKNGTHGGPIDATHLDFGQNSGPKLLGAHNQGSPDSTTTSMPNETPKDISMAANDIGGKSLASLIAEPSPHQVLTATTTLTVPQAYIPLRTKSEFEESNEYGIDNQSLCARQQPVMEQAPWEREFRPNEGLVQHCRDVFTLWGQSGQQPPVVTNNGQQTSYTPV